MFPTTSFDYLSSPRGQTNKGLFDACEIGHVNIDFTGLARYQVISIIGVRPASSFFFDATRGCPIIWWLPDPFADDLSVPWESVWTLLDVNGLLYQHTTKFPWESAWTLPYNVVDNPSIWKNALNDFSTLSRCLRSQEWQRKKNVAAAGYTVRGKNRLFGRNAYAAAIADFDKVLSLNPHNTKAYFYRATAKLALGKAEAAVGNTEQVRSYYRAAIQDYTQVVSLTSERTEAYVFRSYVKSKLGALEAAVGNTERAQRHCQSAIADCNQIIARYRRNGNALKAALAIHTDTIVDRASAAEIRNGYAFSHYIRGLAKRALGQHAEAQADFRRSDALQLMPEGLSWASALGPRAWLEKVLEK